jgi:hypothetical protein
LVLAMLWALRLIASTQRRALPLIHRFFRAADPVF